MDRISSGGFSKAVSSTVRKLFQYRLQLTSGEGHTWTIADPYSFWPVLTDFDVHLFGEGTHLRAYEQTRLHT